MASLSKSKNGFRTIQVVGKDHRRRSIRLGKMDLQTARSIMGYVERLNAAHINGQGLSEELSRWLSEQDGQLYERLVAAHLAPPRDAAILGEFCRAYIAGRSDVKAGTRNECYEPARENLVEFFGKDCDMRSVTPGQADEFKVWLGDKYATSTASRRLKTAKQLFTAAVRRRLLTRSPFEDLKAGSQVNRERDYFVTRDDIASVLGACPDAEWRAIFCLSRFAGLRVPSELRHLTWGDVDWDRNRLHVRSPKTEHHEGKDSRIVPMVPEVRQALDELWVVAPETVHVIERYSAAGKNLITQARRIIKRAGLKPWPKTFHNMRASCVTEWAERHPAHVAAAFAGHSPSVSARHYLQVRESDYEAAIQPVAIAAETVTEGAVQKAVQQSDAAGCSAPQSAPLDMEKPQEMAFSPGFSVIASWPPRTRTPQEITGKTACFGNPGADSGAVEPDSARFPADLLTVIETWPSLTQGTRSQLVNLVRSLIDPNPESRAEPIAEAAVVVRCE